MDKFCLTVINTGFRHNSNIDVFNFIFFLFSYNFYFFLLGQTLDALLMELTAFSWLLYSFSIYFTMISFFSNYPIKCILETKSLLNDHIVHTQKGTWYW